MTGVHRTMPSPTGSRFQQRRKTLWAAVMMLPLFSGLADAQELHLASLDQYSLADPAPGDRMTVIRPFGPWTLRCELSVSLNRRLCALEQTLQNDSGAVFWRLAQTDDQRNVLVFSVPPTLDAEKGLVLKLDGFETRLTQWSCPSACIAVAALSGPLQALMFGSSNVEMSYTTKSGTVVTLAGQMSGFSDALKAAAEDPFGKQKTVKPTIIPTPVPRPDIAASMAASEAGGDR